MTETTEEKAQQMSERYHSTDSKDLKIKSLEAQVTSLTKERDELKAEVEDLNYRAEEDERTIINHEKEMDDLKSQLSNREKEIKELKEKLESPDYHYLAADWDFTWPIDDDNFLHDVFADFPEGSIIEVGTLILGPRRFYISPSTKTFFSSMDEALASLQSKEGEE